MRIPQALAITLLAIAVGLGRTEETEVSSLLAQLESPILLRGNDRAAYRDPAAVYHDGTFHLFYTLVETEPDGALFWYTAVSTSRDLRNWTKPRKLTPRDQNLNFSSPGNVVRTHANGSLSIAWSDDLATWNWPGKGNAQGTR